MTYKELREKVARAIFEHWQFQKDKAGDPVQWVVGGNSLKQCEARDYADAALAIAMEAAAKVADRHAKEHGVAMTLTSEPIHRARARSGLRACRTLVAAIRALARPEPDTRGQRE